MPLPAGYTENGPQGAGDRPPAGYAENGRGASHAGASAPGFWDSMLDTIKSAPSGIWHALTSTEFGYFKDSLNKITPEEWAQAKQHAIDRQKAHTAGQPIPGQLDHPRTEQEMQAEGWGPAPIAAGAAGRIAGGAVVDAALMAATAGLGKGISAAVEAIPTGGIPKISGAAADAVGLVSPRAAHAISLANRAIRVANNVLSSDEPSAPAVEVAPVARRAPASSRRAAPQSAPASPIVSPDGSFASRPDAIPSQHGLLPPLDRAQFFRPLAEPIDYSEPAAPAAAGEPEVPVAPEQLPASPSAQQFEDAEDEFRAWKKNRDEHIEWSNRAERADRFVAYLTREGIEPTPVNLARAAKEMAEKGGAPSDETVDMIHDRMNYQPQAAEEATRSRLLDTLTPPEPAASPAPAHPGEPTELERKLQESIDAANAAKRAAAKNPAKRAAVAKAVRSIGDLGKLK